MKTINRLFRVSVTIGCVIALTGFAPLPQSSQPQIHVTQVDTSHFPQVTVYVSVTDANGRPIGIDPYRIVLSENGAPIQSSQINSAGQVEGVTSLLVIDVSGSMASAGKLDTAKSAAKAFVDQLRPGDRAGLVTFNTQVNYPHSITDDHGALDTAIDNQRAGGDTAMYDALTKSVDILSAIQGRKAIIVLTDGLDNKSTHTADNVIQQIGPAGLSISTIGLGEPAQGRGSIAGIDEAGLQSLAARAGGAYAYANNATALRDLYASTGRALQSEYAITYNSPSTLRDGVQRSLTVSLADAGAGVQAGYNPGGLVPEVADKSNWPLFAGGLAALLVLFFVPAIIGRGASAVRGRRSNVAATAKKGSRVKVKEQPAPRGHGR